MGRGGQSAATIPLVGQADLLPHALTWTILSRAFLSPARIFIIIRAELSPRAWAGACAFRYIAGSRATSYGEEQKVWIYLKKFERTRIIEWFYRDPVYYTTMRLMTFFSIQLESRKTDHFMTQRIRMEFISFNFLFLLFFFKLQVKWFEQIHF